MRRGISPSQLRSCITAQAMRAVLFDAIRRDGQPSGHALTVRRHENWGKCHSGVCSATHILGEAETSGPALGF
jgi:hypothetical protein